MGSITGSRLGRLRAYWLGSVICMAGFLFGYDSGIIGGVLTFTSFENDFRYTSKEATKTSSFAVSLQSLGAFVACFFIWPVTHRLGRRLSLMISSFVFCIGVVIEVINTHSVPAFYVGRVVAGLGLGSATVVVPMYSAEMVPKELRAQIGSFFQLAYTLGIFFSYWLNYGVKKDIGAVSRQWQIPVGLQLVFGALLGLGSITLKESTRWHVGRNEIDKAWDSLRWIRASDGEDVRIEFEEIRAGVALETEATRGFEVKELLQLHNLKLLSGGFAIFLAQQATGATAFAYYAPQYFQLIVGKAQTTQSLLLSGIFGAVKVVACAVFVFFLSELYGRRKAFIFGAAGMAVMHICAAAVVATHPGPSSAQPHVTSSGIATIALIYLFVIIYNMSWGPLPWPYVAEIFPMRIREVGVGVSVSSQWLFSFVFTLVTPYMINNIKWGTFLFWGIANVIIAVLSFLFIKETQGKSLEQINAELDGHKARLVEQVAPAIDEADLTDSPKTEEVVHPKSEIDVS